jgi:hypothetical protein
VVIFSIICMLSEVSKKKASGTRGHNTLYKTGLKFEVMFEISNITAGCCKFQTSLLASIYQRPCAVNVAGNDEINPRKSRAPLKVSILCRDHLESLERPHLLIFKG